MWSGALVNPVAPSIDIHGIPPHKPCMAASLPLIWDGAAGSLNLSYDTSGRNSNPFRANLAGKSWTPIRKIMDTHKLN
jgi:hypothetical protein